MQKKLATDKDGRRSGGREKKRVITWQNFTTSSTRREEVGVFLKKGVAGTLESPFTGEAPRGVYDSKCGPGGGQKTDVSI